MFYSFILKCFQPLLSRDKILVNVQLVWLAALATEVVS